jgi:nucleotide-binding universal stress UspA family protein
MMNLSVMNNILVAIDFSKGSVHAFRYALRLAEQLKGNLNMIWVDNETGIGSGLSHEGNEYRNEAIKNFNDLIQEHGSGFSGDISYKMRRGKVYQEVANMAKMTEANLIVAGTHGVTGYEQYWIGSNAYRIVSYAPCPVITVRFDYDFDHPVKSILVPVDATPDTIQKVPFAIALAKKLGARLLIAGIFSNVLKSLHKKTEGNIEKVIMLCEDENIEFSRHELYPSDITKELVSFSVENKADLIAIMTEQQRSTAGLLLGPQAQQLVNFSKVPVISIKPSEISRFTSGT